MNQPNALRKQCTNASKFQVFTLGITRGEDGNNLPSSQRYNRC